MENTFDSNIVIAEIKQIEKHPNSDKLQLVKVDDGDTIHSVVCGAQNINVGQLVPLAKIDSTIPSGIKIEKKEIRGVLSEGMLCSGKELGVNDNHDGILILGIEGDRSIYAKGEKLLTYYSSLLKKNTLPANEKVKADLNLIKKVGEEIVTEEELITLLNSNKKRIAYDGFEPSGKIHVGQGLLRAININKMIKAGFTFKILVADWHAMANHKMGGDLEKIQNVGKYFIEVWKACGLETDKVEFVWASELVKKEGYWETLIRISTLKNIPRIIRTVEIMGRSEKESLTASQLIYPLMQATDIFMLGVNVAQLGIDQRKVNMLAREIAEEIGQTKPIIVSHHMLLGLQNIPADLNETGTERSIRLKMSKSKPDTAIFMTDDLEEITRKIQKAWCPEGETTENPILEYAKYFVFELSGKMTIKRPEKFGGDIEYTRFEDLENDYKNKKLFPLDLKNSLISYLDIYLKPVREYFEINQEAKRLKSLVDSYQVTR
jgi:tyrosyl-tRNA synthetase